MFIAEFKRFTLDLTALFSARVTECISSTELAPRGSLTLTRADKRSARRDSNESRCFVPLLAHKHYIEHLSNSSYRFLYEENYIAIIIVIELSPSPSLTALIYSSYIENTLINYLKHKNNI